MRLLRHGVTVLSCFVALALIPSMASAQTACHLLDSSTAIPADFGSSYDLFSLKKEVMLKVQCGPDSKATLEVGNGQTSLHIYKIAYEWTGSSWRELPLSGDRRTGNWYIGSAAANLARSEAQLTQDNFVVSWTCFREGNQWKCGCRDTLCTSNHWQLQAFRYVPPAENERDQLTGAWDALTGMKLHWSWTPKASDEGKTGDAAAYWFHPPSTPYEPNFDGSDWKKDGRYRIAKAPNGELAFELKALSGKGHSIANIRPTLWENGPGAGPKIWRLRYRMFLESHMIEARGANPPGMKLPGGMIYGEGARSGGRPFSKAGESCPGAAQPYRSWAERSATMRFHSGGTGNLNLYTYHVPTPGKDCPFRASYLPGKKYDTGRWMAIEIEWSNQSGKGNADGYMKLWIDGVLLQNVRKILWVPPHVPPQEFRGPWFIWYSGGTPTPFLKDTRIWLRDIEVWTK